MKVVYHKGAAGLNTKECVLGKGDWLYETNIDRKEYQTDRWRFTTY